MLSGPVRRSGSDWTKDGVQTKQSLSDNQRGRFQSAPSLLITVEAVTIFDQLFALSPDVRYVALYRSGELTSQQRGNVIGASASETDRYEELFINPTLLTLARQRGSLDCGGASFVMVGYGNFFQLIVDLSDGHASICFELGSTPFHYVEAIRNICSSGLE